MPLHRSLKTRVLTLMAGKPVIRQGTRFVLLSGKNLDTYHEIMRLGQAGQSKEADALLMDLGRTLFGDDFDPND